MTKNDSGIFLLQFGGIIDSLAKQRNITISEAKSIISNASFSDYMKIINEVGASITPPSGQKIAPGATNTQSNNSAPTSQIKAIWPGKGSNPEVGMTVGINDQQGRPQPGTITQVDLSARGVKVKNPTNGQDQWMNIDNLEPYMVNQLGNNSQEPEQNDIKRLQELAGILENCSAGATGAGAVAIAPTAMGKMQRRQPTDEQIKTEYTPKEPAKTVVGDTKPAQASGKLSATLAANGKKTASRINNGQKRR